MKKIILTTAILNIFLLKINSQTIGGSGRISNNEMNTITNTYAPKLNPTFSGTVNGINSTMVGLGNVNNISDADKSLSNASILALSGKLDFVIYTSTIPTQIGVNYKLILVLADESNGNIPTLYFYDGTGLHWIPTSKLY